MTEREQLIQVTRERDQARAQLGLLRFWAKALAWAVIERREAPFVMGVLAWRVRRLLQRFQERDNADATSTG